jgi:uncharacterized protein
MSYQHRIARELKLREPQVATVIDLLDSGNTIPFVARYRKEATVGLDEEQLREIRSWLGRLRAVDDRRNTILKSIEGQEKLTPGLRERIMTADSLTSLEDLYQPFKKKRSTRATVARSQGLEPLAVRILEQPGEPADMDAMAIPFVGDDAPTTEAVWSGARDIVAETISDNADVRQQIRQKALEWGTLRCAKQTKTEDPRGIYERYYDFQIRVKRLRPHQTLAINRGESGKVLNVAVDIAEKDWLLPMRTVFRPDYRHSPLAGQLHMAMEDAARRLLLPSIERDVRRFLTEEAQAHAIEVFARNLSDLLGQPPLSGHTILAIDPGYRTGCKVAVVDATGKVLETATIFPHPPQQKWDEALKDLARFIDRHQVSMIAIGNGTASRETEKLAAELTRKLESVHYLLVNEAGASIYSASVLAASELPELDVTLRGAVSIARRVQDPLAELVKIDPEAIGVGLYQHDVDQKRLASALAEVVESVVNKVGVDLNTASPALLTHVSGIGPKLAHKIVAHRDKNGPFAERTELKNVHGLGSKAFEQSAGFLRIINGTNPLDASAIHPESYGVAKALLQRAGLGVDSPWQLREPALAALRDRPSLSTLPMELSVGAHTLSDIFEQLVRPGRDPRDDLPPPILRKDVLSMEDLRGGMILSGTVRNVVDFGAFIDVGVKQDGLLHRSRVPRCLQLSVGEIIEVEVLRVEPERGRISLGWHDAK